MLTTAPVLGQAFSSSWAGPEPRVSVVVATCNRRPFLGDLLDALERQSYPSFEVVFVDDGSTDGTWEELAKLASRTSVRLAVLRVAGQGGPSVPRNTGVARARGRHLAFTDDDCLPRSDWLDRLTAALAGGCAVVQGATVPEDRWMGPWARTISISAPTGLYETCNLGCARQTFLSAGGFPTLHLLGDDPRARGFGEDVVLGARLARIGRACWAGQAVVVHRQLPEGYRDFLDGRRRLVGFPALIRAVPEARGMLRCGVFLSARTVAADVAATAAVAAALCRRPVLAAGALPWSWWAWRQSRYLPGRPRVVRVAQLGVADAIGMAALLVGSVRYRRLVL